MNRKPIACPDYYPNTFEKLDKSIRESFKHKKGPSTLQASRRNKDLGMIAVPCEQIEKTGPCQAWGYMDIAETKFPQTYLILGTNHHSETKFSTYLFADWETPLGPVKINNELGKKLKDSFPQILNEHTAHEKEHSIEVQLPWLQFASRDKLSELSFIPLSINLKEIKEIKKFAERLKNFTEQHNIPIIASSNIDDTATIRYIKSLDTEGLMNYKQRKQRNIKEYAPLLTLMEISKLKKNKPGIINYQISAKKGDKDYFACINFR